MARRKFKPNRERNQHRSHALAGTIGAYIKNHPDAQYFQMLADLHAQGYRVNRHGSSELLRLYNAARKASDNS